MADVTRAIPLSRSAEDAEGGVSPWPSTFLRALDWRFLLPTPPQGTFRHLVLLGGSQELARCAVEIGVAKQVSCELPSGRVADAVIRLHGAKEDLCMAARCLEPGGVLYGEIERRSRWAPATWPHRIRRSLERAGLSQTELYWCTPDFEGHQAYVPLSAPRALRWYLLNLYAASALRRLLGSVLVRLGETGCSALLRRCAVTAVVGSGGEARPSLLGHPALPGELRRSRLHLLLLAPGNRRVVLLPFAERSEWPLAALKLTRNQHRNHRAEDEQRALAAVYARVDVSLRRTLPRPYGCLQWAGLTASVEGGVAGRLLVRSRTGRRTPNRRSIEDLRSVTAWLTEFHRQTEVRRELWGGSLLYRSLEALFAEYENVFQVTEAERALFAEVQRRSEALSDICLPLVWSHGDLHGRNIYRSADQIGVIDWVSGVEGPPLLDLLKFVLEWNADIRCRTSESAKLRNFEELFVEHRSSDPLVRAIHQEISGYMAALKIDERFIPILLVLLCVTRAIHYQRRAAQTGSTVYSGLAANFMNYVHAIAAHPLRLFGQHGCSQQPPSLGRRMNDSASVVSG